MRRFLSLALCLHAVAALTRGPSALLAQQASPDTVVISLAEAQSLALTRNPSFLADLQASAIARGRGRQAAVYGPNPEVTVEAPGLASEGSLGEYRAMATVAVDWTGQWFIRRRAGGLDVARADAEVRNAARGAVADASLAFYQTFAAERRLEVAAELRILNEQLLGITRIQLDEGEISQLDANLVQVEAGRARARVLAAERDLASARLQLQRITGTPPELVVRPAPELPNLPAPDASSLEERIGRALARRPDLEARVRAVEHADALESLARRETLPTPQVGALVERDRGTGSARAGFVVGVSVPLWNWNRGAIAERRAESVQADLRREATALAVRAEVAEADAAYRAAYDEVSIYQTDVLEPAHANQGLLDTAFVAGKLGLPTLILLRNQFLDAELAYWDSWLAARAALVALESATATLAVNFDIPGDR